MSGYTYLLGETEYGISLGDHGVIAVHSYHPSGNDIVDLHVRFTPNVVDVIQRKPLRLHSEIGMRHGVITVQQSGLVKGYNGNELVVCRATSYADQEKFLQAEPVLVDAVWCALRAIDGLGRKQQLQLDTRQQETLRISSRDYEIRGLSL